MKCCFVKLLPRWLHALVKLLQVGTVLAYEHTGTVLAVARIMPTTLAQFLHTGTLAQFLQLQESCQ